VNIEEKDDPLRGFFLNSLLNSFIETAQSMYLDLVANGVHSLQRVGSQLDPLLQILCNRIPAQAEK
jgi:hypothetical protein